MSKTFAVVDGSSVIIGEGRDPEVWYGAPTAEMPREYDAVVLASVHNHVRHARKFQLPLGRLYGLR